MMRPLACALGFAMLSLGCVPTKAAIPDPNYPHRLAEETQVVIWVCIEKADDGKCKSYTKVKARVLPGWWVAGPPAVESETP
jgi:hypothetical protein